MLPKALLAAALATSTASAFLLPPPTDVEMERSGRPHHHKGGKHHGGDSDIEGIDTSDVKMVSPFYHEFTKVKVPCPGCSMQIRKHGHHGHGKEGEEKDNSEDGQIITLTDVANHINLFFKIDHQDDGDHLLVNHFELYPNVDINGDGLLATQAPDHFHHKKGKGKHHKEHHHDEEEEEKHEKHEKEEHEEKHHEHDHDDHDEELKKRHRHHRNDNDEEEHDGFEGKHWKPKKDFKGVKFHHDGEKGDNDKEFHHGKHHKHGKHLVKVPLGYAMQTQAVGQDASNGMEVVALSLEIIEVNGVFVQNIPAVNIRLIRTPEGGLMIARVDLAGEESKESTEVAEIPGKDRMDALKEELDACTNILCRWKAIIASGIKAHRGGCAGKAKAALAGDDEKDGEEKPHRHHHHKGHHHKGGDEDDSENSENKAKKPHHHHKPMRQHSWKQLAAKFASHILFPVLMGVALGVFVSVVGVAVGTLLVSAWRLLFRRQSATAVRAIQVTDDKPSSPVAVVVVDRHADEEAVEEEKTGLMSASTEELPPYQDNDKKGSA